MADKYRWDNPYEWLMEYAAKLDAAKLYQEFSVIAGKLDSDTIQDLYQSDMEQDGYFIKNPMTCKDCGFVDDEANFKATDTVGERLCPECDSAQCFMVET